MSGRVGLLGAAECVMGLALAGGGAWLAYVLSRRRTQRPQRWVEHVDEITAAEARWTARNFAGRLKGCPCGRPATDVRYLPAEGVVGSVRPEVWTCAQHVGVASWRGVDNHGIVTWVPA